jgi:hypothetical protein
MMCERYLMHLIFYERTQHVDVKNVYASPRRHANAPRAHVPSTDEIRALS